MSRPTADTADASPADVGTEQVPSQSRPAPDAAPKEAGSDAASSAGAGTDQVGAERADSAGSGAPGSGTPESPVPEPGAGAASPAEVGSTADRDRARLARRINLASVALITIGYAALYTVYALVRHANMQTGLLDLGLFDQTIRSYAHFQLPHSPIVGMAGPDDLGKLQWSDHFTPILAILAPLYWIYDGPETLLVAQGVLFALAIPALWIFTRRALGIVPAYCVALAFGLSWTIQDALWFPFHEVSFAVPIMAWMLERFQAGRYRQAALISLLLLGVKEDMGLLLAMFGAYLFIRGCRAWGAGLAIGGPLATVVITQLIIPASGGSPKRNWSYDHFGDSPSEVLRYIAKNPIGVGEYALSPGMKIHTLLWLLLPLAFMALRSPLILLAVPLIAERFLSSNTLYWGTGYHYNAFLIVIVFCASVDGVRRLTRVPPKIKPFVGPAWAVGVLLFAIVSLPKWPLYLEMNQPAFWHPRTPEVRAAQAALAKIPDGVLVAAPNQQGGQLTGRAKVMLWSWYGDRTKVEAPWVLADVKRPAFPFATVADQRNRVDELKGKGYQVVYERDGYVVLHRP